MKNGDEAACFLTASIKHQKLSVLLKVYDKRLEKAVLRRIFSVKRPLQNRVPRVRSLLPLPKGLHKIDAPTENPDKIKGTEKGVFFINERHTFFLRE